MSAHRRDPWRPLRQAAVLGRRSLVGTARQPSVWAPAITFPLLIAAVNTAALNRSTSLPGFPDVESYLDFLLPATVVQGVLLGAITGGSDVALDVENGFFERLVASPVSRSSILLGRLAGAAALGAVQATLYMTVFVVFGARIAAGPLGALVIVVEAMLLAVGVGGLAAAVGLRTGSQEAVQNSFPLTFILVFVSSAFFPTELMNGWYRAVAEHNPLSWMVDGARSLVVEQLTLSGVGSTLVVPATLAVVAIGLATLALRRRLGVAA